MEKIVMSLRIYPAEVRFEGVQVGMVYSADIKVKNIGNHNRKIRFLAPRDSQFKLNLNKDPIPLATGLQVTATVTFKPTKAEDVFEKMYVMVAKRKIEIPLIGLIPSCHLEIQTKINFGTVIANSKEICKSINISNHGTIPGSFGIKYTGVLPITIQPSNGIVKPKSSQTIKVYLCTDKPRIVSELAKVSLQGGEGTFLRIEAYIVQQIIELLDMYGEKILKCIQFGTTFFGTSRIEHAIIYNNSPNSMSWVAVMEHETVGEELGTNLQQRIDDTLYDLCYINKIRSIDVTTIISCIPNEGILLPYQKTVITFCFSPKLYENGKKYAGSSHRQDYALFLKFEAIESKDPFSKSAKGKAGESHSFHKVELALTGSGVPVLLNFVPGTDLEFTPCFMGQHSDILCRIENQSSLIPVTFSFHKVAHFKIIPEKGKIDEGSNQNVLFSFVPHQLGMFKVKQLIDILGSVAEDDFQSVKVKPFHQIELNFTSICKPITKRIEMKVIPGLTPLITNSTGQYVVDETGQYKNFAPVAMLQSHITSIHNHRLSRNLNKDALVAFPNDRSASLRSGDPRVEIRTIFTKVERYNYVDPEFAYTKEEQKQINENKDYYANFTNNLAKQRMLRKSEREFKRSDNAIDIGMAAERGLKSPHLSVTQLTEELTESQNLPLQEECLLITQNLVAKETESLKGKVVNLYKSPSTPQEKEDCNLTLTPKQLHQVVIGPSVLNFGDICVNYLCTKEIHVINNLHLNILVQLEIVHEELKKTNPSSYVIPPVSNTFIPILFEKNTLGTFWKSFSFTINNIPSGNILVKAVVKPVALELSAKEVVLRPIQGFLVKTGYRGTVRLYNRRNCAARFKWQPLVQENGIAFSIRPAKGIVEGYSALDCEVSWLPSYNSPEKGLFNLQVCNGNTLPLTCVVKIGATKVALLAHHVLFENCPQGLTTWKRTVLQNIGSHHAYFKICDQDLLPFITIKPSHGIIPVGGLTSLNIACTPYFSERFDTRAKVIIRHGNELDLRIGGFVDIADIVLSVSFFNFQGVYVGSKKVIRFLLNNKGTTRARVEFDLSHYKDFSLEFKDCEVFKDPKLLNAYAVELEEKKSMECGLAFSPKEVAAYDFSLPISVNFTESSTLSYLCSASQSFDTQLSSSLVPLIAPLVPPCTVKAIVLKPTLKLSSTEFFFDVSLNNQIPLDFFNEIQTNEGQILPLSPPSPTSNEKVLELISTSKEVVNWNLDLTYANKRVKDGTFTFSTLSGSLEPGEMSSIFINFCSMCPGIYTAEVPLHLKDDPVCYRLLSLKGTVRSPKLTFDPPLVFLTPVPLGIQTGIDIKIIPQNYLRKSSVYARVPTIKLYDGLMIDVLSVDFPNGKFIDVLPNGINTELISHISFKSMKPVSFSADVLFLDDENNWFAIQITAVAENCLLTVYPYLAYHLDDQKVILKQDEKQFYSNNEAPCLTCPLGALSSIYSTSTSSSDYESVQQKFGLSVDMVPENIPLPVTERSRPEDNEYVGMKQGQYFFPDEGRKEYLFFEKVLIAVETWFSLFGWSQGLNPISVPESIRRDVSKGQLSLPNLPKKQMNSNSEFARHNKTIYDMLAYLSGQMLPGVATTQTLPIDDTERVMHLHWQHSTLLTFLKTQGACLPYILPEFLLEPEDYKKWIKMKVASKGESEASETPDKYTLIIEDSKFEAMSKRVWTDVLLQTYKVLILSRVAPMSSTNMPTIDITKTPRIKPDFSSSNIYSKPERILLSWMNTNYENVRSKIWDNCNKGLPPPEKWIVNFDKDLLDGLVLATQVAAYCPFLIPKYFLDMYTCAQSPEQRLHNCLIVVKALHEVDLNIDIQATDICDPNPVLMLMFCVYLYENLPFYLPAKIIKFPCSLHSTVVRQLLLKNPSQKSLEYNAKIIGWDAADFSLPPEYKSVINIAPRDCVYINMEFTSRFLHPAEAVLMLISKTKSGRRGTTMTFALKAEVIDFKAMEIVKCKTPCYQWKEVTVNVKSPFQTVGEFSVNLVESSTFVFQTSQINELNKAAKDENTGCEANSVSTESGNDDEYFTQGKLLNSSIKCSFMKEFFCQVDSLFLDAKEPSSLSLHFLPFDLYKRYCVIIFTNKKIGEFIYIVEGTSTVPLPSRFLPINNPCILNYSHPPDEDLSKDDPVLHLKCDLNNVLELELKVPVVNNAKADALAFAAHQQMSSLEYERRKITGTLNSSSVRAAIALLGLTKLETHMLFHNTKSKSVLYSTELSLPEHFDIPKTIYIPPSPHRKLKTLQMEDASKYQQADFALLPLRFIPLTAGRYPCYILLLSPHDIRLFSIECVVNADFPDAKFQFETPAFEALTQNIPINNDTETEWKCIVTLEGDWFYGPSVLYVKSGETAQYPLTFKPILECEVTGSLKLRNQTDGIEHVFELRGIGKKPLPLDHAVIDCQVGKLTKKPIVVPNYTKDMLTYKVTSDLPMVWGCPRITIEPDNAISYILHICPWKRGIFKGAVSFVAEDRKRADLHEIDSEQSLQKWLLETSGNLDNKGSVSDVKVWFFLEINTFPAPPVETIEVTCATLDTIGIEISITNPKQKQLHLDVILTDISLSGESTLTLEPNETRTYVFKYSPMITGSVNESVVFQPHVGIEFWYLLKLTAEKPRPTTLPEIQCYLGKNINLTIPLVNTTRETLELRVINSNPINFLLDTSKKTIFIVPPHSTTEVPVQFYPSALGRANHQASFTFQCKQLKEWIFHLSGIGLVPVPLEPVIIKTCLGRHLSVIIPFRNPSTEHVLVDILLKDKYNRPKLPATSIDYMIIKSTGFNFTLKQTQEIPLPPKGTLDIPVLFVPHIMKLYEAKVIVQIVRANGEYWPYDNPEELGPGLQSLKRTKNGDISHILWEYPIKGIPIAPPPKTHQATLRSRARERVEETVHVLLTGVVFQSPEQRELVVIPKKPPVEDDQNQVPVNNDLPEVHEFQYEIQFESELMKSNLESCIALYLVKKKQNVENAVISLAFNIVFAPKKPIRSVITLAVQCSTDGIWNFPVTLTATEPDVDDVINIEGIGLFKESSVAFRLTSQTQYPESFTAYFLPGSDREFFVKPQMGELLPIHTAGTLISVGFKPQMYSRKHQATLVIQTENIYWMYQINGLPPNTVPPTNVAARIDSIHKNKRTIPVQQRNFIQENTKLITTGVSSTIKGAPLILRKQ
ncbi:cilia- and flagella-associated protein 47 isoform X1 [Monodelphis domestica]|uniref:cilia- and flagella-associated protein 47 isoform X1 n=3 Tax=Monodelphis domestica TaxID=13616 RepID=UPI0024E1A288|nr:cilia- and flagella-associated protein 47 isoform X1 [Monodelphis domestica]